MNLDYVHPVVNTVLYEGYKLYSESIAATQRPRWTVGGLYPRPCVPAGTGAQRSCMETQCLVTGDQDTRLEVRVRFLHTVLREIGTLATPARGWPDDAEAPEPEFRFSTGDEPATLLSRGDDEAVERDLKVVDCPLGELLGLTRYHTFSFPAWRSVEPLRGEDGKPVGAIVRRQKPIQGRASVHLQAFPNQVFLVTVRVENLTSVTREISTNREEAARQAFASTHTVLEVLGGEFVSLMAPPEALVSYTMLCENRGTFPVLVGPEGHNRTVLSSPVILYDHPTLGLE
tara:strand:- start:399 stop:1259 length:861 start_codon:yes stop_codon:yes gene_type:complete